MTRDNINVLYWTLYCLMMIVIICLYVVIYKIYEMIFSNVSFGPLQVKYIFLIWTELMCTNHLILFNHVNLNKALEEREIDKNIKVILYCIISSIFPFFIIYIRRYIIESIRIISRACNWLLNRLANMFIK